MITIVMYLILCVYDWCFGKDEEEEKEWFLLGRAKPRPSSSSCDHLGCAL